jgi:hypothetical protein
MNLLASLRDSLFGNDQRLTRPDFNRFAHIELDFSGIKVRFKDAAHTAMFPINDWPTDMDIYDLKSLNDHKTGSYGKRYYVRGWDFYGKKNQARGGCKLYSLLYYFPAKHPEHISYFSRDVFERELIEFCHRRWGVQNPGSSLGDLGPEPRYVYPVNAAGLSYERINGTNWCRFTAQWKADPPKLFYACPISSRHLIINYFTLSAYDGLDFYSPETNLEQTAYDVVNDFMSEYFIELSPRSQAERAEAPNPV